MSFSADAIILGGFHRIVFMPFMKPLYNFEIEIKKF